MNNTVIFFSEICLRRVKTRPPETERRTESEVHHAIFLKEVTLEFLHNPQQ